MNKKISYIIQDLFPSFITNLYLSIRFKAFVHPTAKIYWPNNLQLGKGVIIGRGVVISAQGSKKAITIGARSHIDDYSIINNKKGKIRIGERTHINQFCIIQSSKLTVVGNNVAMAPYVRLVPDHRISGGKVLGTIPAESIIGDNSWIGAGVTIILGNNLGEGSVVGANAVVNKSVPAGKTAVGVPIRIL